MNQILDFYRDQFRVDKEEKIILISININSLHAKGWQVKKNQIRDFALLFKVDIIAFKETNVNQNKLSWRDRQEERLLGQWEKEYYSLLAYNIYDIGTSAF